MTSNIVPFDFDGAQVRVVTIDGDPWFVGTDVTRILGYANPSDALQRIDDDDLRFATLALSEGSREVSRLRPLVNESGVYALAFGSTLPRATDFRRWVTREVLPSIRRTGSYGTPALTGPALMAAALIEAQAVLEAREAQVAELTPRAEAWDALAATDGDYSMRDAAQILCRDHGIDIGQNRLSKRLREIGWVDPAGIPYQRHVDLGRVRSRARYYTHARTQERVLADPQIRITPKGVADLRTILATKEISA